MTRRVLLFAGATLLLIAAGLLTSRYLFRSRRAPEETRLPRTTPPPVEAKSTGSDAGPTPKGAGPPRVVVVEVNGKVERRSERGPWQPARIGDNLGRMELIRTGEGAAKLQVGERSRLTVQRSSELSVREITDVTHRFRLEQGRLSVDYREDGKRVIQIEGKGGKTVARAKAARFSVLGTGKTVAVATETGVVDLSSAGSTVKVAEGQQSVVVESKPPAPPSSIPKEVALKVARASVPSSRSYTILRGITQPGNRVLLEGRPIAVDDRGRFSVKVPLKPGTNSIELTTEDASGRRKRRNFRYFAVSSASPVKDVKVTWGKKHKLDVTWEKRKQQ
jgi:hypothetical protein